MTRSNISSKYINGDWDTSHAAAGTTAATATALSADNEWIATVTASSNGVKLKAGSGGDVRRVFNADSADSLNVYPPSSGQLNGATADLPITLPAGHGATFFFFTALKIGVIYG